MRSSLVVTTLALSLLPAASLPAQLIPRKPPAAPVVPAAPGSVPAPGVPAVPLTPATPVPAAAARPLKDEDMDRLIRQLAEIEATLQGKRSTYNNSLLAQLKEAGNSEEKAFQLWLDGTKEFDFDEKGKTSTEFAEWKRTKGKELHNPQFMTALRLQVKYLSVLIIYSNAPSDSLKSEAIAAAAAYLDDLAGSARKLDGHLEELNRPVLDGVIAKHLKLDASLPKSKADAGKPGNIQEIYEKAILPYYREKGQTAALLSAWQKLITQETAMVEAEKIPEKLETFNKERLPALKWSQAREMFEAGQEDPATSAMLAIIKGNMAHKQTENWISEMTRLLQAKKESAPPAAPGSAPAPAAPSPGESPPARPSAPAAQAGQATASPTAAKTS